MKYLHYKQTLFLYRQVIEQTGGTVGLRDERALRSALEMPTATFSGIDLYMTIFDKAAILLLSIIKNHPFVDGNKRLGMYAMEVFLRLNSHRLTASQDALYDFAMQIAKGELHKDQISAWLEKHSAKIHRI